MESEYKDAFDQLYKALSSSSVTETEKLYV